MSDTVEHRNIQLLMTSGACPEQYDAVYKGETVGYFRLRDGCFSVRKYGPFGAVVFEGDPDGDGAFTDQERERWLISGINALADALADELT